MPVPSSGEIKISDLVAEFGGDAPHALSEYYRGGARVTSNNTNVPTSGQFRFSNAYGAVNEIAVAATSSTNVDLSSLFGGNWTSTVPKRLTIGSGVTIGGTGSSAAIIIPSNMAGTLAIDNAGSVLGFGGAAGAAGGNAISNSASGVTINNTGLLAGGGGGGGTGGAGGNGTTTTTSTVIGGTCNSTGGQIFLYDIYQFGVCGGYRWIMTWPAYGYSGYAMGGAPPQTFGGATWSNHSFCSTYESGDGCFISAYRGQRTATSTVSTTGGAGGSGGVGQGYTQTNASGSAGAAGGTNAGTGGTGGAGATYGNAGSTGATGANGNVSNGSAGSAGGAAGAAVAGTAVTMNNTGTLYGAVA